MNIPISEDSHRYNGGLERKCYLAAFNVAIDLKDSSIPFEIVHGVATCGPNGDCPNLRFMHAWVEIKCRFKTEQVLFVIDASNPTTATNVYPARFYYQTGRINDSKLRRYRLKNAVRLIEKLQHFGPWHKPMEPASDWTHLQDAQLVNGLFHDDFESEMDYPSRELVDQFIQSCIARAR